MSRKSLWFGLAFALVVGMLVFASADAKPKKKKIVDRGYGPPSLSLVAEPSMIKACNDESARVRLIATARSPSGAPLRYKWNTQGGRLRGEGANPTWDLAGAAPGVYQAWVEVDDGRDLNCVAFSSISIVVTECPPPPVEIVCPTVTVSCPDAASENSPATFTANVSGGPGSNHADLQLDDFRGPDYQRPGYADDYSRHHRPGRSDDSRDSGCGWLWNALPGKLREFNSHHEQAKEVRRVL